MKLHQHMRDVGLSMFSIHLLKKLTYSVNRPNFREKIEGEYISSLDTIENGYNQNSVGVNYLHEQTNHKKPIKCGDCWYNIDYLGFNTTEEFHDHLKSKEHASASQKADDFRISMFS